MSSVPIKFFFSNSMINCETLFYSHHLEMNSIFPFNEYNRKDLTEEQECLYQITRPIEDINRILNVYIKNSQNKNLLRAEKSTIS